MVVIRIPRTRRAAASDASAAAQAPGHGASAAAQHPGGASAAAQHPSAAAQRPGGDSLAHGALLSTSSGSPMRPLPRMTRSTAAEHPSAAAQRPGDDSLAHGALFPTSSGSPMRPLPRMTRSTAALEQDADADGPPAEALASVSTASSASLARSHLSPHLIKPLRFHVGRAGALARRAVQEPDRDGFVCGAEALAPAFSAHAVEQVAEEKTKTEVSENHKISKEVSDVSSTVLKGVTKKCTTCAVDFMISKQMHRCRKCGETFCGKCSRGRITLTSDLNAPLVRVCDKCRVEVSQMLKMEKEGSSLSCTIPQEATKKCTTCSVDFILSKRRHRCRKCGETFCGKCSQARIALTSDLNAPLVRVCDRCLVEVSQMLNMAKEGSNVVEKITKKCTACAVQFILSKRMHQCRKCGETFCRKCSRGRIALTSDLNAPIVRVCDRCLEEIGNMEKEASSRSATVQSHDDLARKSKVAPEVKENSKQSTAEFVEAVPFMKKVAMNTRSNGISKSSAARLKCNVTLATDRRVALIYDSRMLEHAPPEGAVVYENPERLKRIMQKLMNEGLSDRCQFFKPDPATTKSLRAVHNPDHVEEVESLSSKSQAEMDAKALEHDPDGDMYYCKESSKAALLAAGSVIKACDLVAEGEFDFSFALVRPPGHHVGKDGPPAGFCLLNNVAVGAAHLLEKHQMKRILILDWDVHHGDGTQNIFLDDNRVLFFSVHRFNESFFPNTTGSLDSIGAGSGAGYNINVCWKHDKIRNADYVAVWEHLLLPVIQEFEPEIIVISAGYDAAEGDPLGFCNVTPSGFAYLLEKLMPNPIVMALEGGYDLDAISDSVAACVGVLLGDKRGNVSKRCLPYSTTWTMIKETREKLKLFWKAYLEEIPEAVSSRSKCYK